MKAKITKTLLEKLKPKEKPYEIWDSEIKNFLARVLPSGKIAFYCSYRRRTKKSTRYKIGDFGIFTTQQARVTALQILGRVQSGEDPSAEKQARCNITLKEFLTFHYEPWSKQHHKSWAENLRQLNSQVFSEFHRLPLDEISSHLLDRWRTRRRHDGVQASTLNRDLTRIRAVLSKSVSWGFLKDNPLQRVKLLRLDRASKARHLNPDEEIRLLEALAQRDRKRIKPTYFQRNGYRFSDYLTPMIIISVNTGLRKGELLSLRWDDINFHTRMITVRGINTKSSQTRHIPFNRNSEDVFIELRKLFNTSGFVFSNPAGEETAFPKRAWTSILISAQISNFRWHDLRHHFASKLVMKGKPLRAVQALMGHSDFRMVMHYSHLSPSVTREAVEALCE